MWTSPPSVEEQRFVLLSPSLKNRVGHYHDYADRVLKAAGRLGYRVHAAVNRAYSGDLPAAPVFRRTCGEAEEGSARRLFGPDRYQRALGRLLRRGPPRGAAPPPPRLELDTLLPPAANRGLLRRAFRIWRRHADGWADHLAARDFAADLQVLYERIGARADDLTLLGDAGVTEVRGLARFLRRHRPRGRWAVVLRRDITDAGSRWTSADWAEALRDLTEAGRGQTRLYADTEGLAGLYSTMSGLPVGQLPIPVTPSPRRPPGPVFEAVYLGDARDEKGFPILAQAILAMEAERRAGAVAFTLQSHFNAEPGDPATARARAALREAGPGVRMVGAALDTDAYGALLGGADVVLTPYDPIAYQVRSSGVMSEALATGSPVLVTAGSWMAGQIQPAEQAHLADLRDRLAPLPVEAGRVALSALATGDRVLVELSGPNGSGGVEVELAFEGSGERRAVRFRRDSQSRPLLLLLPVRAGDAILLRDPDAAVDINRAWRAPATVPASAVGVIVDHHSQGIREGVAEIAAFREHYRQTAAASSWARTHSGQALIKRLAADFNP